VVKREHCKDGRKKNACIDFASGLVIFSSKKKKDLFFSPEKEKKVSWVLSG